VVNIGNSRSERLVDFIDAIEAATGRTAERNHMDMQAGDVPKTWADASLLQALTGYTPQTGMRDGVAQFVRWFGTYHDD
jgi:UDP-glucuronate 4-epimerase